MKPHQQLRAFLQRLVAANRLRDGMLYRGPADFVQQHGRWYEPAPLATGFWRGAPRCCFGNAIVVAVATEFGYVEGYALPPHCDMPVHHAWNVSPSGRLHDVTWPEPGRAYLGVEFSLGRADDATWHGDANVLDDWKRRWPLLRQRWQGEDWERVWKPTECLELARQVAAADGRFFGEIS